MFDPISLVVGFVAGAVVCVVVPVVYHWVQKQVASLQADIAALEAKAKAIEANIVTVANNASKVV